MIVYALVNGEHVERKVEEFYRDDIDMDVNVIHYWDAAVGFLQQHPGSKESDIYTIFDEVYQENDDGDDEFIGLKKVWHISGNEYHINVYEVTKQYGGPEEGGWWYNSWKPCEYCEKVFYKGSPTKNLREFYADKIKNIKLAFGDDYGYHRPASSAAGGFDLVVQVELEEAKEGNNYSPWC